MAVPWDSKICRGPRKERTKKTPSKGRNEWVNVSRVAGGDDGRNKSITQFTDHTLERGLARCTSFSILNFLVGEPMLAPLLKTLGVLQPQSKRTYPHPQQLSADP